MHTQELPELWNNVKKVAVLMKQSVAPLQAAEVGIVRRKLSSFDVSSAYIRIYMCIATVHNNIMVMCCGASDHFSSKAYAWEPQS